MGAVQRGGGISARNQTLSGFVHIGHANMIAKGTCLAIEHDGYAEAFLTVDDERVGGDDGDVWCVAPAGE